MFTVSGLIEERARVGEYSGAAMKHPPGFFEDRARFLVKFGAWSEAAWWFNQAADASLGAERAGRYRAAASDCHRFALEELDAFIDAQG